MAELCSGHDHTLEVAAVEMARATLLQFSASLEDIRGCNVYLVTVPTPIDASTRLDLTLVGKASEALGEALNAGDAVIYEATVHPGCTEEVCIPILERWSGLVLDQDFFAGFNPARINPGDEEHRLTTILKVTSGSTPEVAVSVDRRYASIITAGTCEASWIKVAKAARVIENTRREPNIAPVNERAKRFDKRCIGTLDVFEAARTCVEFPAVQTWFGRRALRRHRQTMTRSSRRRATISQRRHPDVWQAVKCVA